MNVLTRKMCASAKGAALVEYSMLVGLIAVLAIVAVTQLGTTVRNTFDEVSSALSDNIGGEQSGGAEAASAPAPTTGPYDNSITFVAAEAFGWLGVGRPNGLIVTAGFGTDTTTPEPGASYYITDFAVSGVSIIVGVDGDFTGEAQEPVGFECDNGLVVNVNAFQVLSPAAGVTTRTNAASSYTGPAFVAGETYTCNLTF